MNETIKVLILEDVPDDAELIMYELKKGGINASSICVETKEDFVKGLNDFDPDIIFADYKLPAFSGLEALEIVKENKIKTPFIFISGTLGEELAVETIKIGASDYILKNNLIRLAPSVKRVLKEAEERNKREIAEKLLKESEEKFRSIFETAPNLIILLNNQAVVVNCNNKIKEYLGYNSDEIIGRNITDFIHPDFHAKAMEFIHDVLNMGFSNSRECRMIRKDMAVIDVKVNSAVLETGYKEEKNTLCIIDDITEQKRAQESISYLSTFPELYPHPIIEVDFEVNINYMNPSAKRLFPDMLSLKEKHPWLSGLGKIIKKLSDNKNFIEYREVLIGEIWYQQVINNVKMNDRIRIYGIDITGLKQAEESLWQSEWNFIEAQRLGRIGHWEYDVKTDQIKWSDMTFTLYERDPKLGPPSVEEESVYYSPEDAELLRNCSRHTIETGVPYKNEVSIKLPGGKYKYAVATGSAVRDSSGKIVKLLGTVQDITEQKQAELALQESKERYKELFDNISSGVAVYKVIGEGDDFIFTDFNKAGEKIDYEKREDIIGKSIFEARPGIKDFGLVEVLKRVWQTGRPEHFPEKQYKDDRRSGWYDNYIYKLLSGEIVVVFNNVTERKRAENELRESESSLQYAQVISKMGSWEWDMVTQKNKWSDNYFAIHGFKPDEIEPSFEFFRKRIHPDDVHFLDEKHADVMNDKKPFSFDARIILPDSKVKWIQNNVIPVIENDKIVKLKGIIIDITERKQVENELKFKNIILKNQQEASIDGILAINENGRIISFNKHFTDMWGIPAEIIDTESDELVLKFVLNKLVSPEDFLKRVDYLYKCQFETSFDEIILSDGRIFERYSSPMIDQYKEYYGRIWYFRDITKRKKSEIELTQYRDHLEDLVEKRTEELEKTNIELNIEVEIRKKAEENLNKERTLLRTLIDALPDQIYFKDRESRFIYANYNVLKAFGMKKIDEIIGKTDFDFLNKKSAESYFNEEQEIIKTGNPIIDHVEKVLDDNGEIRWLTITKAPIYDNEHKITGIVGITRNITMLKYAENVMQNAKEQAEKANKAKSSFLSNMSHEIRTPMNAILGFTQLILRDSSITSLQRERLESILKSGEHLLSLINDILQISKIEAGHKTINVKSFDLYAFLDDIEMMFKVKTEAKNLTFKIIKQKGLHQWINTDQGKLRQIFINLIGNAVKFTDIGMITVRVSSKPGKNKKLSLFAEIEDTGTGIPSEDIQRIFEPFEQADEGTKATGTGIGLALTRQFVLMLGGEITVKSKIGTGSCFCFSIIINKSGKKDIVEDSNKKQIAGLKTKKKKYLILIADDNYDNRKFLSEMLLNIGFKVIEAENGQEAIDKFKKHLPDLILMDLNMKIMNGYEASKEIKSISKKKIPIIAVTASAFSEEKEKIFQSGIEDIIIKPFKEQDLLEMIALKLGTEYVYSVTETAEEETSIESVKKEISNLPDETVSKMLTAIKNLELNEILSIINVIEKKSQSTGIYLKSLARKYQYDTLKGIFKQK